MKREQHVIRLCDTPVRFRFSVKVREGMKRREFITVLLVSSLVYPRAARAQSHAGLAPSVWLPFRSGLLQTVSRRLGP
jgi:hypothetical protein